jgi:hypothetical protein
MERYRGWNVKKEWLAGWHMWCAWHPDRIDLDASDAQLFDTDKRGLIDQIDEIENELAGA